MLPAKDADLRVRLLNADGSEAEISGNGTRCVAAWYCAENNRSSVVIRTGAGLKTCELMARDGNNFEFRSSMGEPEVGDEFSIKFTYGEVTGTPVSMGNPHYVVFVPEFELGWQAVAEQISTHHDFKHGMNVEFVKLAERSARSRCAFASAAWARPCRPVPDRAPRPWLPFTPARRNRRCGYMLPAECKPWNGAEEVFLTGPATLLCRGEFFI